MTLSELGDFLRDMAPFASLAIILIAGWRLFHRIHEAETKLGELAGQLKGINAVLLQARLDAEKIGRSLPEQLEGLEHYHKWDTRHVRSLMRVAKRRVWILQTWFPEMEADIQEWHFDHAKDLDVRVLMAAETNPAVLERVRFRGDFRKDSDAEARSKHIAQMTGACEALIQERLEACPVKTLCAMRLSAASEIGCGCEEASRLPRYLRRRWLLRPRVCGLVKWTRTGFPD